MTFLGDTTLTRLPVGLFVNLCKLPFHTLQCHPVVYLLGRTEQRGDARSCVMALSLNKWSTVNFFVNCSYSYRAILHFRVPFKVQLKVRFTLKCETSVGGCYKHKIRNCSSGSAQNFYVVCWYNAGGTPQFRLQFQVHYYQFYIWAGQKHSSGVTSRGSYLGPIVVRLLCNHK